MHTYTLHRIALNEHNKKEGFAMRNRDGEAFELYDLDDMRGVYEMLRAYFERGEISTEPVEREELDSSWCGLWMAVRLARAEGAPELMSDEQIQARLLAACQRGAIPGAHLSVDGSDWWIPRRALQRYAWGLKWGERKPVPPTEHPTITLPDTPFGINGQTVADALADGQEIAHQDPESKLWYMLYLGDDGQIIGVADEEQLARSQRPDPKANRIKVEAGHYEIGDIINGRAVKGFGQSWTEGTLSAGQLWQPCKLSECEREPVCVACQKCSRHCTCDVAEYCYAYFV